jgi:hypothetical protein
MLMVQECGIESAFATVTMTPTPDACFWIEAMQIMLVTAPSLVGSPISTFAFTT